MSAKSAQSDHDRLAGIEAELARGSLRVRFDDPALQAQYDAEQQERARPYNRIAISLGCLLYDLYFVTELRVAPEIVLLSAVFRFVLLSPGVVLFVLLDWRGRLGRLTGPALVVLAVLPTILAMIETVYTTSITALPNLQAIPLIQLAVLACRMSVGQAAIVTTSSCLMFGLGLAAATYVPPVVIPSLLLTDLAIGVASLTLAMRLDVRDRQVFLLGLQAAIRGELLAAQNNELARLSQLDALTGLGNRRCFDAALNHAWADGAARPCAVGLIMFDIDHFKAFNDAFGHQAGDECLRAVAASVRHCVRNATDTLARYGGEEFALVLRETTLEEARSIAERIREAVLGRGIAHPCIGPPGVVTVSLGVASMVPDAASPAMLVAAADRCLYAAKRHGRNRVEQQDSRSPIVATPRQSGVQSGA